MTSVVHSLSLSADSPFFDSSLESFHKDLKTMRQYLISLNHEAKNFCKCGRKLGKTTRNLSRSMKAGAGNSRHLSILLDSKNINDNDINNDINNNNRNSIVKLSNDEKLLIAELNNDLSPMLERFGNIMEEIASSQEVLSDTIQIAFIGPLQRFCDDIAGIDKLKNKYRSAKNHYDNDLGKYLHGGIKKNEFSAHEQMTERAIDLNKSLTKLEIYRYKLVSKLNELHKRTPVELTESLIAGLNSFQASFTQCLDIVMSSKNFVEDLQKKQQIARKTQDEVQENWKLLGKELNNILGIENKNDDDDNDNDSDSDVDIDIIDEDERKSDIDDISDINDNDENKKSSKRLPFTKYFWKRKNAGKTQTPNELMEIVLETDEKYEIFALRSRLNSFYDEPPLPSFPGETIGERFNSPKASLSISPDKKKNLNKNKNHDSGEIYMDIPKKKDFIMQGPLFKKSHSRLSVSSWYRRWFVLTSKALYYVRNDRNQQLDSLEWVKVCDIILSTVREPEDTPDARFTFEIVSPNNRPYLLHAESKDDYDKWVNAIRKCIEFQLTSRTKSGRNLSLAITNSLKKDQRDRSTSLSSINENDNENKNNDDMVDIMLNMNDDEEGLDMGDELTDDDIMKLDCSNIIEVISTRNKYCADCGNDNPTWIILNFGILVCIACSGVHRSLGTHISIVRSITLDRFTKYELYPTLKIGNINSNNIWEYNIQEGWRKLTKAVPMDVRQRYIQAKYQFKAFINNKINKSIDELSKELWYATERNDINEVMNLISLSADINWKNIEEGNQTSLHIAGKKGYDDIIMLLVWRGGNVDDIDDNNGTVISYRMEIMGDEDISDLINILSK